jgi:hypothetical protein
MDAVLDRFRRREAPRMGARVTLDVVVFMPTRLEARFLKELGFVLGIDLGEGSDNVLHSAIDIDELAAGCGLGHPLENFKLEAGEGGSVRQRGMAEGSLDGARG